MTSNHAAFQSIQKQISFGFVFKALNAASAFIIIKLALDQFGNDVYGTWVTILSTITWFSCIEVGVSSGIRNAITVASDEASLSLKRLIGAAMGLETWVFSGVIITSIIIACFIPHNWISQNVLWSAILFALFIFSGYILSMINAIALARHKAHMPVLITFIQNVLTIGGLLIIQSTEARSIFTLGAIICLASLLAFIIGYLFLFTSSFAGFRPSFNLFDLAPIKSYSPDMWRFGIIQFFVLIIFTSDNLIILYYISNEAVAEYNVTFKYFNVLNVLFNLILIPFWSAFSSAQHIRQRALIVKMIRFLVLSVAFFTFSGLVLLYSSDLVFEWWLDGHIPTNTSLSVFMLISALLTMWNHIFVYYLSGIGLIRLYSTLVIISGLINIPLSIILVNKIGMTGVIVATSIALLPQSIILPVQTFKSLQRL